MVIGALLSWSLQFLNIRSAGSKEVQFCSCTGQFKCTHVDHNEECEKVEENIRSKAKIFK